MDKEEKKVDLKKKRDKETPMDGDGSGQLLSRVSLVLT